MGEQGSGGVTVEEYEYSSRTTAYIKGALYLAFIGYNELTNCAISYWDYAKVRLRSTLAYIGESG